MNKNLLTLSLAMLVGGFAQAVPLPDVAAEIKGRKVYETRFMENAPYGVTAWANSTMVKRGQNRESRFSDYNSDSANGLILDATVVRDVTKEAGAAKRETAFYSVYDEKGWYLYIEGEEPLIKEMVDSAIDPQSAARQDSYEIFFAPGLRNVPYYQLITRPLSYTSHYDWGVASRDYRSLENYIKVESLPLDKGFGTSLFVPWEAIYKAMPQGGEYWRFSFIRWQSYSKAGGVTWGGKVHDTGNFGLLHFQEPTPRQKELMKLRLLRISWFNFLAKAKAATTYWSDEKTGDPMFYNQVLKPVIDQNMGLSEALGAPKTWTASTLVKAAPMMDDWMEFDYKVGELRTQYLMDKRFAEAQ